MSLFVAEGGPLVINAGFPQEYRAEAEAHSRALDALKSAGTAVDWFYVSPPGNFGAHNPGTRTGTFRLGTDVLLVDANGFHYLRLGLRDRVRRRDREARASPGRFTLGY